MEKKEFCAILESDIKEIDRGVEGLANGPRQLMRDRLIKSLNEADKPDGYYPTRNRVINIIMGTLALILAIETVAILILNKLYGVNINYFIYLVGITLFSLFFMPNSDELAEKILRSDNLTLRKIFIPQKN